MVFDAYWMYVRDARALKDTTLALRGEWLEDVLGVDDYDTTEIHTVGLRASGELGRVDFEAEAAYQWGDAGQAGFLYKPLIYGDDGADYDAWGCNLEVGYTFDRAWYPRVYLAYAFFEGEDERDISFGEWLGALFNPFYAPGSSVSFNRLFSNYSYSGIMDGTEMSNMHFFHAGVGVAPTDSIEFALDVGYYVADEPFAAPAHYDFGKVLDVYRLRVPWAPFLSFWTETNDDELGWEVDLSATYYFNDDLYFAAGWVHLFVGDGLEDGSFVTSNGHEFIGGTDGDDADYFWFETGLSF